ncbi:MAG: hypothetical protein JNK45_14285 [Myxococcales bacterium]|jgi:hypothetical protein|nr:hypothetical protein [Myxococcales bacterium]
MSAVDRWGDNPFFVLDLPVTATRAEVERAGQKWLGMLEVGMSRAAIYTTPLGVRARTPELVRAAMAELRDPERRIGHELWHLEHEPPSTLDAEDDADAEGPEPEPAALRILGWSRP